MDNDDPAAQEARVKRLWQVLDTKKEGQVSLTGLKNGLRKMDHRTRCTLARGPPVYFGPALKNADSLLQDVLKAVDADGNGTIEYNGETKPLCFLRWGSKLMRRRVSQVCRTYGKTVMAAFQEH